MTGHLVTKGAGGQWGAPGLGHWKQRAWWSYDADAGLADGHPLTFRRTNWSRLHLAESMPTMSGGAAHVVGQFDKTSWLRERGTVTWAGVDYEFGTKSGWKGTFALSRLSEELVEFKVTGFKQDVQITVAPGVQPPSGLLLFCAWVSQLIVRDRSSAG